MVCVVRVTGREGGSSVRGFSPNLLNFVSILWRADREEKGETYPIALTVHQTARLVEELFVDIFFGEPRREVGGICVRLLRWVRV